MKTEKRSQKELKSVASYEVVLSVSDKMTDSSRNFFIVIYLYLCHFTSLNMLLMRLDIFAHTFCVHQICVSVTRVPNPALP